MMAKFDSNIKCSYRFLIIFLLLLGSLKPENKAFPIEENTYSFCTVVELFSMLRKDKLRPSSSCEQVILEFVAKNNNSPQTKDQVKYQVNYTLSIGMNLLV